MVRFRCEECNDVTNSCSKGALWQMRHSTRLWSEEFRGRALCALCAPTTFKNGGKRDMSGRFDIDRVPYDESMREEVENPPLLED